MLHFYVQWWWWHILYTDIWWCDAYSTMIVMLMMPCKHYDDACKQSIVLTSSTTVISLMSSTTGWAILNSLSLGSSTDVTHSPNVSFFSLSCTYKGKIYDEDMIWHCAHLPYNDDVHLLMMKYDMMHWVYSYTVVYVEWREMMYSHIMYTQLNSDEWCTHSWTMMDVCTVVYEDDDMMLTVPCSMMMLTDACLMLTCWWWCLSSIRTD